MVCKQCGAELREDKNFCASCGAKVSDVNVTNQYFQGYNSAATPVIKNENTQRTKMPMVIAVTVVLSLLIIGLTVLGLNKISTQSTANTKYQHSSATSFYGEYEYDSVYVEYTYNVYEWTLDEIQLAINTILARNHYKFTKQEWIDYFSAFSWYDGYITDMNSATLNFNEVERANYDYLAKIRNMKK